MFKKIKSFVKGVCSKAKSAYENTEAKIKAKVIKLLIGNHGAIILLPTGQMQRGILIFQSLLNRNITLI